jgi:diguanylate cyclase (GGDEF)-like protein/PAS domain S-box-containing protein
MTAPSASGPDDMVAGADFKTLFDFLPVGAYRSLPDGRQVRANPALVALNGYASEAEMLASVSDIGTEWYVDRSRRDDFRRLMERDGRVIGFVSEIYRHHTRERIWISENAHVVRDADGRILFYEGTVEEITHRVADEVRLRRSEEELRLLTSQVPGMLYRVLFTPDGTRRFSFVSAGVSELFGVSPAAVMADGELLDSFRHPDEPAALADQAMAAVVGHHPIDLVFRIQLRDGTCKWAQMTSSTVSCSAAGTERVGVILDITARTEAEAALRNRDALWKLALESTGDGVWDWNIATGEEIFSKRCLEMYGYDASEMRSLALEFDERTHPDDRPQMERDREAHFQGLVPAYVNEHRVRCKDGSWKWILSRGMVIDRDAQGRPARMVGTHTDITERRQSQALIWQQANFDALTGLPNRRMLRDRLEQNILQSRREGLQLAVLFIDLDHFKQVNDTVGHAKGDVLLAEAATRIRHCVRETDTVARLGGDEFTVVLSELSDPNRAADIARHIVAVLGEPFVLDGEAAFVTASVGITLYPDDACEIEDLLKHADQALYVAKGAGRNRVSHFTPALQEAAQTRGALAKDLRRALAEHQFQVHYQPIVELASGRVHKAEALIRWFHPQRGLVSPATFIPIAESTGLIVEIGDWVFREAAVQAKRWRVRFDPKFQLSVNKSPVQFANARGSQQAWFDLLEELGLPGQSMVLEITESLLLDAGDGVNGQLLELRDAGVGVSLDDFGTGYSSMSYLQRYDIDFLKIDQSFVRNLAPGGKDLALCKAITVMAHELGLQVVAEGVETEPQCALLRAAGCDFAQGYLFARPMPPLAFESWIEARTGATTAEVGGR